MTDTHPQQAPAAASAGATSAPAADGPMLAADGTPLKRSLRRALRAEKLRALALIAPLLVFILITFVAPIADMLFRSVENQIVEETLPRTTDSLSGWDHESGEAPDDAVFEALYYDLAVAVQQRNHTRLGSRLNYEYTGISSLFRQTGRDVEDVGDAYLDQFEALDEAWAEAPLWLDIVADPDWLAGARAAAEADDPIPAFELRDGVDTALPRVAGLYPTFAMEANAARFGNVVEDEPWPVVYTALYQDLTDNPDAADEIGGPGAEALAAAAAAAGEFERIDLREALLDFNEGWRNPEVWAVIQAFSPPYTSGYFLTAVDLQKTPDGIEAQPEDRQIYVLLFERTLFMSLVIMGSCILLGYPIAYLLATLPLRQSNLLMILVLLPFWTSLLVRTSAWKVLLQQQGVINDILVWMGMVGDDSRLTMINNQFGTIVAMTHILLPFMILPLYSVMKTIPPSYVRAAKSLGATNWTAFWRVYFPNSVPGIGAGCILVFILSIGYYITPELVGGTTGTFISNRIAYHISSSLNWGLAAALGSILLAVVMILYWAYDKIVGIDNVNLG